MFIGQGRGVFGWRVGSGLIRCEKPSSVVAFQLIQDGLQGVQGFAPGTPEAKDSAQAV